MPGPPMVLGRRGSIRFCEPRMATTWTSIRGTTADGATCAPQLSHARSTSTLDCDHGRRGCKIDLDGTVCFGSAMDGRVTSGFTFPNGGRWPGVSGAHCATGLLLRLSHGSSTALLPCTPPPGQAERPSYRLSGDFLFHTQAAWPFSCRHDPRPLRAFGISSHARMHQPIRICDRHRL